MLHIAYYEASIQEFCSSSDNEILGKLTEHHRFSLKIQQRSAWIEQIRLLQLSLENIKEGEIFFEFSIPRMGKRADVVLIISNIIFVVEFKVGVGTFDRYAWNQVYDYALDLKNFHRGSHNCAIVPVLIATKASIQGLPKLHWAMDGIAQPVGVNPEELHSLITSMALEVKPNPINILQWKNSGYQPTPTIIEAAQALYRDHDVREISRSDSGAKNLGVTTDCLLEIIENSKRKKRKAICFVTGVPGSGKTLAGLNIATMRAKEHDDEHAVFLSGNGPLVEVLREALARDQSEREKILKDNARRKVASFVQNIHHFRDEALNNIQAPVEKVVVFDEAQRAWNKEQTSKFMQQKRGSSSFDLSEPEFLIRVMDRHEDWCVVICLIGGGQEINTGEAGLAEWFLSISRKFPDWDVYTSYRLNDPDYFWDKQAVASLEKIHIQRKDALHLSVSMRSYRAESLSNFVASLVDNRPDESAKIYKKISNRYPIVITRDLNKAKSWLRHIWGNSITTRVDFCKGKN